MVFISVFASLACLASAQKYPVVERQAVGGDCYDRSDYVFPLDLRQERGGTCLQAQMYPEMRNAICDRVDPNYNLPVAFFCPIVCHALAVSAVSCVNKDGQHGYNLLKCLRMPRNLRATDSYYDTWYTSMTQWCGKWVYAGICFAAPPPIGMPIPNPILCPCPISNPYPTPSGSIPNPIPIPIPYPIPIPIPIPNPTPAPGPVIPAPDSGISFNGIRSVYSFMRGEINVSWSPPILDGMFLGDKVYYYIFVADGQFNFDSYIKETSIADLINYFKASSNHQIYQEEGDGGKAVYQKTILSQKYSKIQTLLIIAQFKDMYLGSTSGLEVRVAKCDPHIRDKIHLVGPFIPSRQSEWKLEIEEVPEEVKNQSFLIFSGDLPDEVQSLYVGSYVSGIVSSSEPFILQVSEVIESKSNNIILRGEDTKLENIYDKLDLDGFFDPALDLVKVQPSRPSSSSRKSSSSKSKKDKRALANERYIPGSHRKLIWQEAYNSFVGVVDEAIGTIGDIFKVDISKNFNIGSLGQPIDQKTENVHLKGNIDYAIKLKLDIQIDGAKTEIIQAGVKGDYVFRAILELTNGNIGKFEDKINLWRGETRHKTILIGKLPVILEWTPRFELFPEATGTWNTKSSTLEVFLKGYMQLTANYENNRLYGSYKQELSDAITRFDSREGRLNANIGLQFSTEISVYKGLISSTIGLESGIEVEVSENIIFFRRFELPIKASALYNLVGPYEETFLEGRTLI